MIRKAVKSMRTRNHFCVGEGIKGFQTVLSGHFPAGRIALLCEDLYLGQKVAAALSSRYKTEIFSFTEERTRSEEVRFVVGVGGGTVIEAVRAYAKEVPFAFFARSADYRFLNLFDGTDRLAEFAYLDKENETELVPSCYTSVFSLWAETVLRRYEESYLPFRDNVLTGLADSAERILFGLCDKTEFLTESLRLISAMTNALRAKKRAYVACACEGEFAPEKQFTIVYFLLILLFNFTKIPFSDMLNPSDETKDRHVYAAGAYFDKTKMKSFLASMKAMTELPQVETSKLYARLYGACLAELPLVVAAKERGLFEGLQDEEFRRNRGIFI